eukprot:6071-Heterococcus_DN1.PRE.2
MPRRRAHRVPQSSLVQHRTPDLAKLLNEANSCEVAAIRRFLAAGGLPDTLVTCEAGERTLLSAAISNHHFERSKGKHSATSGRGSGCKRFQH